MRLGCGLLYPHFVIAWCGAAWLPVLTRSGSTSQGIIFPFFLDWLYFEASTVQFIGGEGVVDMLADYRRSEFSLD